MKIIYDISVVGMGCYNERARTGISRVVENVAIGLEHINKIKVNYCAIQSPGSWLQASNYFKSEFVKNNGSFNFPSGSYFSIYLNLLSKVYPLNHNNIISSSIISGCNVTTRIFNIAMNLLGNPYRGVSNDCLTKADIFHSPFFPFPEYVKVSSKLKRFITVYDLIPILYPQYFKFKEDHLINKVVRGITPEDWVLAISHSTKDDLCNFCDIDPSRVFVTHLAASGMFFPCREKNRIAQVKKQYNIPNDPYVLSLCTLEPRKNIRRTIKCFLNIVQAQNIKDLNLVLVGTKGWDFEHIFAEIENTSSLRERIIVTGYIPDTDLAPLYSGAMMFVYPSLYEGFGLPPLEAMQCGVPVITSNTSSLPEVVGNAGIMIDPLDEDALAHAMWNLYSSPAERSDLAEKSLHRASDFSWKNCVNQTVAAYRTAMES